MRRALKWLAGLVVVGALLAYGGRATHWSDSTPLEVQFLIHDQETGATIRNAKISSTPASINRSVAAIGTDWFELTTDELGIAALYFPKVPCHGASTWTEEKIYLQAKEWEIVVTAAGYVASLPLLTAPLDVWHHPVKMPGRMQVTIPIALQRHQR